MTSKTGKSFSGKLFLDKTEKAENQFRIRKTKTDLLTVKSVKEDLRTGIRYYDHHIHDNPKELYLDTKKAEADFQTGYRITEPVRPENQTSAFYYDKRLYEIYQCSQAKFLDKNFEPNKAIVAQESIHPNIKTYSYFISGLQIEREIFTVKSVIGIDQANNKYYDHKVFDTEKSILIDLIEKRGFYSTQYGVKPYALQNPLLYYDKRFYEICQCPTNSNCKEFLFSSCFIQSLQVTSAVKYRMKHRSDVLSNKRN